MNRTEKKKEEEKIFYNFYIKFKKVLEVESNIGNTIYTFKSTTRFKQYTNNKSNKINSVRQLTKPKHKNKIEFFYDFFFLVNCDKIKKIEEEKSIRKIRRRRRRRM